MAGGSFVLAVLTVLTVLAAIAPGAAGIPKASRDKKAKTPREVVWGMYSNVLARPPDTEGIRHYLSQGVSVAQIADELLRSEEFREKHGEAKLAMAQAGMWHDIMVDYPIEITDVQYLYKKLLGRDVDKDALDRFVGVINGGAAEDIPTVFELTEELLGSQEFTEAYAYWKVLGRSADADGKKHFAEIASGTSEQPWALSIAQVVDELLSSEEFAKYAEEAAKTEGTGESVVQARAEVYANVLKHFKVDMPSVTHLYIKILGRYPDDGAKKSYEEVVGDSATSVSVLQLTEQLLRSDEFVAQGELAMKKDNYIAKTLGIDQHPLRLDGPLVSMLFTIGDHPSKEGDEPTIVDHALAKSKISPHSGGV